MSSKPSRPQFTCAVNVQALPEQTDPAAGNWAYAYTITITNTGDITAQLVARHWLITDADGQMDEVRGLAVVGHQPVLKPGESFEYTSWTRLATAQGTMRGTYYCITEDAHWFETPVPEFMLAERGELH
jgi:ApaG protein